MWIRASASSARAVAAARRPVREDIRGALCAVGQRQDLPADRDEHLDVVDAIEGAGFVQAGHGADRARLADEELRDRAPVRRPDHPLALERSVADRDAEEAVIEVDAAREARHVGVEPTAHARGGLEQEAAARPQGDLRVAGPAGVAERGRPAARLVDDAGLVLRREPGG